MGANSGMMRLLPLPKGSRAGVGEPTILAPPPAFGRGIAGISSTIFDARRCSAWASSIKSNFGIRLSGSPTASKADDAMARSPSSYVVDTTSLLERQFHAAANVAPTKVGSESERDLYEITMSFPSIPISR